MDEPLLRRFKTLKVENTGQERILRQVASGYLYPRSTRRQSTFKVQSNETILPLFNTSKTIKLSNNDNITNVITIPIVTPTSDKVGSITRSNSSPALFTEEKGVFKLDSLLQNQHRRHLSGPEIVGLALVGLLLYIIIAIAVFTFASEGFEGHQNLKLIEAVYFTVVTLSTIGYGDIVPATTFTKLFTCTFILVGFGFIDVLLNALVTFALDKQEEVLLSAVDENQFNQMIETHIRYKDQGLGDQNEIKKITETYTFNKKQSARRDQSSFTKFIETFIIDKKKGRMRIRTKMSLAFGVVILCLVLGTVCAHIIEDMTWIDSFYLSVTSVTTVGYGDYSFKTTAGKCFAIIWLLASTFAVARAFLCLTEYRMDKRNHRTANIILRKKLTLADFVAVDMDNDGCISKAEYVLYKLKEMGRINEKDIQELCVQFDTVESSHNSKITVADLMESDAAEIKSQNPATDNINMHPARR